MISHDAFYKNCTLQMVPLYRTKGLSRVLDKKWVYMTFPPEPLDQIQNKFTELFLIIVSTKIAQQFARLNTGVAKALDEKCR